MRFLGRMMMGGREDVALSLPLPAELPRTTAGRLLIEPSTELEFLSPGCLFCVREYKPRTRLVGFSGADGDELASGAEDGGGCVLDRKSDKGALCPDKLFPR